MIPSPEAVPFEHEFHVLFLSTPVHFPDSLQMLAAEKHKGTFLAPVGIGLSLFIAELAGMFHSRATFESLN